MQQTSQNLDRVFFALSDGTRRGILARLAQGSTTIGELAAPFEISKPAISKHMKILENAGLIERKINGRQQWPAAPMHLDDRRIKDRGGLAELPSPVLGIAFRRIDGPVAERRNQEQE
jgi:DNA-binding transcriptional ArsR family regulator